MVICPTCSIELSSTEYMQHFPACYFDKCESIKCVPLCTCPDCKGRQPHIIADFENPPSKRQSVSLPIHSTSAFDNLPKDILPLILAHFQKNEDSFFVGLVCKKWNALIQRNRQIYLSQLYFYYSSLGSQSAVKLLRKWSVKIIYSSEPFLSNGGIVCRAAAQHGHLDLLQWSIKEIEELTGQYSPDYSICSSAALGGHLEILKWARGNGFLWDSNVCKFAASGGHLEVLKWARKHGCSWNSEASKKAARNGHLEVLKWIIENEGAWSVVEIARCAALNGHLNILKWMKERGWDICESICNMAAWNGHLEVLKWARECGYVWDSTAVEYAKQFGHTKMVDWIKENTTEPVELIVDN